MKHIDSSSISNTTGLPVKAGTLDHLQNAYKEAIAEAIKNLIGPGYSTSVVYILSGCRNSGSGLVYNISAGSVFYNGEVYLVDAASFTAPGGQVAVGALATTFFTDPKADPVLFTDGVSRNVHQIIKLVISAGVSGSTIADFSAFQYTGMVLSNVQGGNMPAALTLTFSKDEAIFYSGANFDTVISFDLTNARPGVVKRVKWTYGTGRALSFTTAAGQTLIKDSGDLSAVASANNVLYIMYCGKDEAGNDQLTYSLKQV